MLTIIGLQFSFLLAGTIIIENVFYLPGLGRLVFQAINQRDLIVVKSVVMLLVASVIVVNFLVDLAYAVVDPRLRRRRMSDAGTGAAAPATQGFAARALRHPQLRARAPWWSLCVALMAAVSLVWTPHDPTAIDIAAQAAAALGRCTGSGTDQFGRDTLSMIMRGAVTSIAVSFVAVGIGAGIGVPLGLLRGGSGAAASTRRSCG